WLSRIIILGLSIWIYLSYPKIGWMNQVFYGTLFQVVNLLDFSAWGTEKLDHLMGKIEKQPIF
ncbi:MAG TPA: hypothetical protein VHY08_24760, partial [Bacillota bacterium]|nr:hypothetical protein [Bacillota bacterium]